MNIVVVGGGIAGLAAAVAAVDRGHHVTVLEATAAVGGKLRTSMFAGRPIDEGADAFLIRTPAALALAQHVGVTELCHPAPVQAAVWRDRLHRLPSGLVLGVPRDWRAVARTSLLSWPAKLRLAADLVLPAEDRSHDSIGTMMRHRLGNETHDYLVDTLVGSIYATNTDRAALSSNPQIAALATNRSLILGALARPVAGGDRGPIFAAPLDGMGSLATAAADWLTNRGVKLLTKTAVDHIDHVAGRWVVAGHTADAIIVATPAGPAATILQTVAPIAAARLNTITAADIAIVRLAVAGMPSRLHGLSGYLVPKPKQRLVTAASFGSQKWRHWAGPDSAIIRVSLGRDGVPTFHLSDNELIDGAIADLNRHLGTKLKVSLTAVTRWPSGFPQYRPGHARLISDIESALPASIAVAGATYHGIGVPACITSGQTAVSKLLAN